MSNSSEYEAILAYINDTITPHLRLALRAVGTARPEDPVAFIAECFLTGEIPDTDGMPGAEAEQPLGAYITEHRVVELVQQAVGICAAAQPPPENPLLVVGQHLRGTPGGSEPEPSGEEETPTDTLWVGRIPVNLVGGDMASILNINANKNISSLFSQFGKVKHSTVRIKNGENKSWALITFEDVESATRAKQEGVSVLDAGYEEVQLRVEYSDVEGQLKRNGTGYLSQVSRTHSEVVSGDTEGDTVWVGAIPRHCVIGEVGAVDGTLSPELAEQVAGYGELLSSTVRVKDGVDKSWALITFQEPAACKSCVEGGLHVTTLDGERAMLRLNRADVDGQRAAGGGQGALERIHAKHEEEVEAARALMRQMWADAGGMTSSQDGSTSGGVVRKLARYKAFDRDRTATPIAAA